VKGHYPTRLFWDVNDARLLVCEARLGQSKTAVEETGVTNSEVIVVVIVIYYLL